MQEKIKILKVRFDSLSLKKATEFCLKLTNSKKQHYITTPNPEILLVADKNHKFRKILNNSALNLPDGIGILWAAKFNEITRHTSNQLIKIIKWITSLFATLFNPSYIKTVLKGRVTGVDLVQNICKESNNKIYFLGAEEGIAEKAANILKKEHPNFKICGSYAGSPKPKDEKTIIDKIKSSSPDILFVAYGAPAQEMWISRNLKRMPSVKLAAGIGGSFDFISGKTKRAPRTWQKLGLEWLYRLIQEPSRLKRIINATIVFPFKVLKSK